MNRLLLWSTLFLLIIAKTMVLLNIHKLIQMDISEYFLPEILLVIALAIVLVKGTLVKSKLFFLVLAANLVILLSIVLYLWQYAGEMSHAGAIGVIVTYLIHFYRKQIRGLLDYLKLVWVISFYFFTFFYVRKVPILSTTYIVSYFVFIILFAYFVYLNSIKPHNTNSQQVGTTE
jgi:hypothetical protein